MEQNSNYWKSIGNGYVENLIPVRELTTGTIYDTATVRIRPEQEDLFDPAE